ncbi:MAG: hypothetical protein H6Q04_1615 [Acidobacteria bacterium]|nr:hypothetical protein [Acidobacteriota bacterium]
MNEKVFVREGLYKETPEGIVLVGNKCPKCGGAFFPKAEFCTRCLNRELEEMVLSKRGKLYSYTITRVPVAKYPVPHAIGMITLPEKVRITAPLVVGDRDFKIGDEMEMEITTLWSEVDRDVIGYKFKAV